MKKILLLGLLLFLCGARANAVTPYMTQPPCYVHGNDSTTTSMNCHLTNTHTGTGYTIFLAYQTYSATETITSTEAFTCPANARASNNFGFPPSTFNGVLCYVQPSSAHSDFSVTVAVATGGGTIRIHEMAVAEVYGLGTVDTSGANNQNNGVSVNVTTNNANEYIMAVGFGLKSSTSFAGSGMTQLWSGAGGTGSATYRHTFEFQFEASTGTYATPFVDNTVTLGSMIVALPFQTAGSTAPPAQYAIQACLSANFQGGGLGCDLSNVASGNKLVFASTGNTSGSISASCSGETCTCPASSQLTHTYSGTAIANALCYGDMTSGHSTYSPTTSSGVSNITMLSVFEMVGLNSSVDAGSEANAAAQSVSYTPAANNEYTFFVGTDATGTAMAPGGSFAQESQVSDPARYTIQQIVGTWISPSGSSTASFSGANTKPLIATFSFGSPSVSTQIGGFIVGP